MALVAQILYASASQVGGGRGVKILSQNIVAKSNLLYEIVQQLEQSPSRTSSPAIRYAPGRYPSPLPLQYPTEHLPRAMASALTRFVVVSYLQITSRIMSASSTAVATTSPRPTVDDMPNEILLNILQLYIDSVNQEHGGRKLECKKQYTILAGVSPWWRRLCKYLERIDIYYANIPVELCIVPDVFNPKHVELFLTQCTGTKLDESVEGVDDVRLYHCDNITNVSLLSKSNKVELYSCNGISDISPLANVHTVELIECPKVSDVSMLSGVRQLKIYGCDNISEHQVKELRAQGVDVDFVTVQEIIEEQGEEGWYEPEEEDEEGWYEHDMYLAFDTY